MISFDQKYFQKIKLNNNQLHQFLSSALRDLKIAERSNIPEVKFKFAYDALIKLGITLVAKHGFRVRSKWGHHVKILSVLSAILNDEDIEVIGNKMRQKRNIDLYEASVEVTEKEAMEYFDFVKKTAKKVKPLIVAK